MPAPADLLDDLKREGQEHLVAFWDDLDGDGRRRLAEQVRAIDLATVRDLFPGQAEKLGGPGDPAGCAGQAVGPGDVVRQPKTDADGAAWRNAAVEGERLLAAGKVGAVVVAGGQGTRLGFDKPKGMFPIGPVSGAPLFRVLAEQVLARGRRAGAAIPYYVMTSDATHDATVAFFEANGHFGLAPGDVFFFKQGTMPAVDAATGKLLLESKGRLALSPDGHGGILAAMKASGAFADMRRRGVELLHYHQIDNPTAVVCDPAFLGWHSLRNADASTKVVAKVAPTEKMGVVCDVGGVTQIIEYSDLPGDLADKRDAAGEPIFWAGNTAIHVFGRAFLERLTEAGRELPFHVAHKKVPFVDAAGRAVEPTAPNAFKFERFIFDALPLAGTALVVEADRGREFNPVKNAQGADSPATAKAAIDRVGKAWLAAAGAEVASDATVEIAPLFALDEEDVRTKVTPGTRYAGAVLLRD